MAVTPNFHLFVYGSLRQGFHHPAYAYISRYFNLAGPAQVQGCLYDLGEYPAAKPSPQSGRMIHGELYAIKNSPEFDYAMAQLDDYEGVNPEEGVSLFIRELTAVSFDNQTTTAWIYWYNHDTGGAPIVESGDVLEYFRQKNNP